MVWLGISVLLGGMGLSSWLLSLSGTHLWILLLGAAALCLLVHLGHVIERHGLVALLPGNTHLLFSRPLFAMLHQFVTRVTTLSCYVVRIGMLACMDLNEAQSKELLEGLDPELRRAIFQQPLQQMLPSPLQRLLFGRQWRSSLAAFPAAKERSLPSALHTPSDDDVLQHDDASRGDLGVSRDLSGSNCSFAGGGDEAGGSNQGLRCRRPAAGSSVSTNVESGTASAEDVLEAVRLVNASADRSQASATYSTLEKIFSAKAAGTAVGAARLLVGPVAVKAVETANLSRAKVSELGEGVQKVAADPKAKVAAASAVGGAVTLGASGGATGLVSGGLVGATLGLVPALFTFGLSIPVGAALGGGAGLCVGSAVGGTAGFVGGGVAGYKLSGNSDNSGQIEDRQEQDEVSLSGYGPVLTEVPAS